LLVCRYADLNCGGTGNSDASACALIVILMIEMSFNLCRTYALCK